MNPPDLFNDMDTAAEQAGGAVAQDPLTSYAVQNARIAARRRLAEQLVQQGLQGNGGQGYHGGRVYMVGNQLGNIAKTIGGAYMQSQAEQEAAANDLAQRMAQQEWSNRYGAASPEQQQQLLSEARDKGLRYELEQQFAKDEAARLARLWSREESVDPMTGKPVVNLHNRSNHSFPLDFPHRGMHYAYIVVRKHPRYGTDAMITVDDGQLHCQYRNCRILVRFDQGKPTSFSVSGAADNSSDTWFIDNTSRFISQLSSAKNVIVELQFYRQGIRELKFETTGFKRP